MTPMPEPSPQLPLGPVAREYLELMAERDRYRKALERIGRVHGPWRAVVAEALGCGVDDLDPRKRTPDA